MTEKTRISIFDAVKKGKEKLEESAKASGSLDASTDLATAEANALAKMGLENAKRENELALSNETIEDRRAHRELRKKYASRVFRYLCGYSVAVFALLLLDGFNVWCFSVGEEVLKYLVGSTAAAAIGLVYAVTHGLFKDIK